MQFCKQSMIEIIDSGTDLNNVDKILPTYVDSLKLDEDSKNMLIALISLYGLSTAAYSAADITASFSDTSKKDYYEYLNSKNYMNAIKERIGYNETKS